jgi:hypothetical protein
MDHIALRLASMRFIRSINFDSSAEGEFFLTVAKLRRATTDAGTISESISVLVAPRQHDFRTKPKFGRSGFAGGTGRR